MNIERRALIGMMAGAGAFGALSMTEQADAHERQMLAALDKTPSVPPGSAAVPLPQQPVGTTRAGTGRLFGDGHKQLERLGRMPEKPTLADFFAHRFGSLKRHCLQSATHALHSGEKEELVLGCLLHDLAQEVMVVDHGWWAGQMMGPYVSEKVAWAIQYHQALRFYPDDSVGYKYPDFYDDMFGKGYVPEPYIRQAYEYARKHKWYMEARMITVHDFYAFDPNMPVSLDPFVDIIGRHFHQPKEGLGFDNSPSAHLWRSLIFADHPL